MLILELDETQRDALAAAVAAYLLADNPVTSWSKMKGVLATLHRKLVLYKFH